MSSINFNELKKVAKQSDFALLAPGEYQAQIVEASVGKTKSTDKDKIQVKFRVSSGPEKGKPVRTQFVLSPESPNAMAIFFRQMNDMGIGDEFFDSNPSLEKLAKTLEGRYATIVVEIQEFNDRESNKVKSIYPPKEQSNSKVGAVPDIMNSPVAPAAPAAPAAPTAPAPQAEAPAPQAPAAPQTAAAPPEMPF